MVPLIEAVCGTRSSLLLHRVCTFVAHNCLRLFGPQFEREFLTTQEISKSDNQINDSSDNQEEM